MAEAAQRLQRAVELEADTLERSIGRPMQTKAYTCMAKCSADTKSSAATVAHCIDNCTHEMQRFEAIVQQQMSTFQNRLSRCAQRCQDQAQSGLGPNSNQSDIAAAQASFDKCQDACAVEFEQLAKMLGSDIRARL